MADEPTAPGNSTDPNADQNAPQARWEVHRWDARTSSTNLVLATERASEADALFRSIEADDRKVIIDRLNGKTVGYVDWIQDGSTPVYKATPEFKDAVLKDRGDEYQDLERRIDRGESAMTSREGEKLASILGVSTEELDRRMKMEDDRRDAAGLPGLASTAIRDRAGIDDFGVTPSVGSEPLQSKTKAPSAVENDQAQGRADESTKDKDLREQRQREAQDALQKRFHVSGNKYHRKDENASVAFTDTGNKLITQDKDAATAAAMAMAAEAKGWSTIKVSGDEKFRREVWLEASLRGISVKGYQPKEADLAALDIKREQRSNNGVEPVSARDKVRDDPSDLEIKKVAKSKQQAEDYNLVRPNPSNEKAKTIEALAKAVATEKIKNPVVRQQVMAEVSRRVENYIAKGKELPSVKIYDKDAPAKSRASEHAPPAISRNAERTR